MILEIAQIEVKAGMEPAFEEGVTKAAPIFQRAKGCKGMELQRSLEQPARYRLFVRWQALILVAFTVCKVFLYDVSQLGGSYRIVSFIALGAVLLGISFIYQRDWLGLSTHAQKQKDQAS